MRGGRSVERDVCCRDADALVGINLIAPISVLHCFASTEYIMADKDMNPMGDMRDPFQMLHDMKTKARKNLVDQKLTEEDERRVMAAADMEPLPTRGAAPGEPGATEYATPAPRIDVGPEAGVYAGAGGYEYEVRDDGAVKILKAPKDRGLGVTLTRGMAYDAIMDELRASTPKAPMVSPESGMPSRDAMGSEALSASPNGKAPNRG